MTGADTVLILGLGESGLAMARWCAAAGAQVRVWDSREAPPQGESLARELPQAERLAGELTPSAVEGVTLVLKSPGLAPYDPRIAPLTQEARVRGIPVRGELDLFVRALAELKAGRGYAPQLIAITGTNGKTTTTAMAAQLVARAGKRVGMAGNIGPTLLDTLAAAVAEDKLPEVWVLELSSFQLEGGGTGVEGFAPDAAAVLNITQDHLDWHGSMAAYTAAKARVFGSSAAASPLAGGAHGAASAGSATEGAAAASTHSVMVLNRDDARVAALAPALPTPTGRGKPKVAPRPLVWFGLGAPERPGDFGLIVENGMAWLVRALPADETHKPKPGEEVELHLQRLMPADALRVRGRHNAANALAALALATAIGCPLAPMLHGLREYAGEPHRVQWVATVADVEAYDDSKGTNVGATVAALEGLGADKAPSKLVVVLGGEGKGQDFTPLAAPVARHARAVALIGRDAPAIEAVLADAAAAGLPVVHHASLEAATRWCFEQARAGDAVLLSPACASLDMFRNYGHRAEVFISAVQGVAAERGAV